MKRKFISLVLAFCLLLSVMPVSAFFADDEVIPETGVFLDYDLEGWSSPADMLYKNGGKLFRAGGALGTDGGNHYWTPIATNNGFLYSLKDVNNKENTDVINTGKLKWQFDVRVPKGDDLAEGVKSALYLYFYAYNGWHQDLTSERAYLASVDYINDAPVISFGVKDVGYGRPSALSDGSNAVTIEFDKWYTITAIVDYDLKEVNYYLDGELITYYMGDASTMVKQFTYYVGGVAQGGNATSNFAWADNFLVERLAGGYITAKAADYGENYVDVKFDTTIDQTIALSPEDYSMKILGESDVLVPETAEFVAADTIRLTFADKFEENVNYELALNGTLYETGNAAKVVKIGTKVLFVTSGDTEEKVLVDQTFEDVEFPTEETSADFDSFYYYGKTSATSETDFEIGKELTYKYAKKADNPNGGSMLRFEHSDAWPLGTDKGLANNDAANNTHHKAIMIPFADGTAAKAGKLTVEFDALVKNEDSTKYQNFGFGLHDSSRSETAYSWQGPWADATLFAGLTWWSANASLCLVPGTEDNRAKIGGYYNADFSTQTPSFGASDYKTLIYINPAHKFYGDTNGVHNYKFEIDLDSKSYKLYYDGIGMGTYNYIPGGGEDGSYDGFVIASVDAGYPEKRIKNEDSTFPIVTQGIGIDNVKVTHIPPAAPVIAGISFEKYDGTRYDYGELLPAGTKKAVLTFSNAIDEASAGQYIELAGAGESYNLIADGNDVILDFDNCLTVNSDYVLTVKSGLEDVNGGVLARDVKFEFSTDEGEVVYRNPVIKANGEALSAASAVALGDVLTAEAEIINTTLEKKGAYAVLLAYKDKTLVGVAYTEYAPHATSLYSETLTVNVTADENFVGADALKAFVFDNLSDLKPLTDACVID